MSEQNSKKKVDPKKLAMVSDYLKRTIAERPYGFILASIADRLDFEKIDYNLRSMGLILVPPDLELKKLNEGKTIGFLPYCCKPFDCPLNSKYGRKSQICKAIDEQGCDHPTCTIERFIKIANRLNINEFLIIDEDANLFEWLAEKRNQGFEKVIGVACEFSVSYAFEVISGQLGYDGLIILINGDKCRTKDEYAEMDSADRGRLTFIDEWTLDALEELIDRILEEPIPSAEDESAAADR